MAHTTTFGKTNFIHNGDYSGYISIVRGDKSMTIPVRDLERFLVTWQTSLMISKLEQVDKIEQLIK